jgi:hypothetical protein
MALSNAGVPTIVASSLICLLIGGGLGAVGMRYVDSDPEKNKDSASRKEASEAKGGMMRPAGAGGGGIRMGGRGGGQSANPMNELAALVTKLDVLTRKPLTLNLTDEQRAKVREQLQGLDTAKELSDEEAKKRLNALLEVVKDDRAILQDAGFRWPGERGGGGGRGGAVANPFTEDPNKEHLKALQERMKDKTA